MWQPANKATLPSPGDFKHAKNAIDELEDALKDALALLEQAQSRVLALTKELDERKAWVAPIRKLPSEILSEIFVFGSYMEHLAPLTITEVSRLWRAIVLATPQAWSLIYVSAPEHEEHLNQYVSTFIERSNPCPLHIWIRGGDYDADSDESEFDPLPDKVLPLLRGSISRIWCLSIGSWQLGKLSEECMPNLVRLTITDRSHGFSNDIPPFFTSRDRFPRLQSIRSTGSSWGDSLSLTSFPPLQELSIQANHVSTWLDVIKSCSATLKALVLVGHLRWTEHVTIIFPILQSLALSDWSDNLEPEGWSITMVTPGLISYDEFSPSPTSFRPRHGDVKSVIYLETTYPLDLAPYTSLRALRLSPPEWDTTYFASAGELAEQLKQNISKSPALELVEFRLSSMSEPAPEHESFKRHVIEKVQSVRPGIELSFACRFSPMPGSIEENSCKPGMPCSQDLV